MNPIDSNFPAVPYLAHIGLTYNCNCACFHCYASGRINNNRRQLTPYDYYKLLQELYSLGTVSITYSHGETLLCPFADKIFEYTHTLGIRQTLISNGILIDYHYIEKLVEVGIDALFLSLDSLKEESHNFNRQKFDAFKYVISSISALKYSNIHEKGIATTIAPRNESEIEDIVIFAIEQQMNTISFLSERGENGIADFNLNNIISVIRNYHSEINIVTHDPRLLRYVTEIGFSSKKKYNSFLEDNKCLCRRNIISIDIYGDVRLCNFIDDVYGNIFDTNITELWKTIINHGCNMEIPCLQRVT